MLEEQTLLSAIFSDETELFRTPSEPEPWDTVRIRLRVAKGQVERAVLIGENYKSGVVMNLLRSDEAFDYYETAIVCGEEEVMYRFLIESRQGLVIAYDKAGVRITEDKDPKMINGNAFRFIPGFHVPAWAKGAVQYQIFPDRFCNGDTANDVADNEYYYTVGHSKHVTDWNAAPSDTDIRCFYGGDLRGVIDKLDYLQDLGVEVIYLNPVFVSPSSHKYDCQDYEHIDPHFGVIIDDDTHTMQSWEKNNAEAGRYVRRVTSMKNLEASDALFSELCGELHRRGMRIILDGVFNHCGSFNKWMDSEGIYANKTGFKTGAFQSPESPYRSYFHFNENASGRGPAYEGWWGFSTLPKLNYEGSVTLENEILSIAERWAAPPYSIDGWRLDVAADLGHSAEYNHTFWKRFRERVKRINPDILIVAEHYGDPGEWLKGDEWDTVMNYDAFMEPVSWFLTGMEKHSDSENPGLYRNGAAFFEIMRQNMSRFTYPSLMCAMNELSNHDHSRFLTRTNRTVGRSATLGPAAARNGIHKSVFREAVTIQMTWPGAPTVYYADEAGQVGWTDPDNRRTYPWGHEDMSLISLHRDLISLRKRLPVLRCGSVRPLLADYGLIAYARFDADTRVVVAVNNTESWRKLCLPVQESGAPNGEIFYWRLKTDGDGHSAECRRSGTVEAGKITLDMAPYSSAVLANTER